MIFVTLEIIRADFRETLNRCNGKASLVFCSPPYGKQRKKKDLYGEGFTREDYFDLGKYAAKAITHDGNFICNIGDPMDPTTNAQDLLHVLCCEEFSRSLRVQQVLIWQKNGYPGTFLYSLRQDHEYLVWCNLQRGSKMHPERLITGSDRKTKPWLNSYYDKSCKKISSKKIVKSELFLEGKKLPGSVFCHKIGVSGRYVTDTAGHPATFPLSLAEDMVNCFSDSGDLVCDPFVGSGTTAVAAVALGRSFIGGDLHENGEGVSWSDVAIRNIRKMVLPENNGKGLEVYL